MTKLLACGDALPTDATSTEEGRCLEPRPQELCNGTWMSCKASMPHALAGAFTFHVTTKLVPVHAGVTPDVQGLANLIQSRATWRFVDVLLLDIGGMSRIFRVLSMGTQNIANLAWQCERASSSWMLVAGCSVLASYGNIHRATPQDLCNALQDSSRGAVCRELARDVAHDAGTFGADLVGGMGLANISWWAAFASHLRRPAVTSTSASASFGSGDSNAQDTSNICRESVHSWTRASAAMEGAASFCFNGTPQLCAQGLANGTWTMTRLECDGMSVALSVAFAFVPETDRPGGSEPQNVANLD